MARAFTFPSITPKLSNRAVACSVALGKAFSAKLGRLPVRGKLHDYRFRQMADIAAA
jgi:hypothetical protein